MKKILLVSIISFCSFAWAETFQDNIHSIDLAHDGGDHIIMLQSGRVAFLNPNTLPLASPENFLYDERVELVLDKTLTVKSITFLGNESPTPDFGMSTTGRETQAEPTILENYSSAQRIFNKMNRTYKNKSECTDRAHIWSYEEWLKNDLTTQKVFLFFTKTYIRKYRYKWWFHTSPYALVNINGNITERVLDRRFSSSPRSMKSWTDIFIRSRKECPISTYGNYRNNRYGAEHCYIVKTSMYYRLPLHIDRMERYGTIKTSFNLDEVNFSYRAFNNRYTPAE